MTRLLLLRSAIWLGSALALAACNLPPGYSAQPMAPPFAGAGQPGAAAPSGLDASSVCGSITMSADRLACVKASQGKTYTQAELETCQGMVMGEQKRDCIASSGTTGAVATTPPPSPPSPPPPVAPAPPAAGMRTIPFQNAFAQPVTRLVWRPTKEVHFREVSLRRPISAGARDEISIGTGRVDLCYEFASGERVFITGFSDSDKFYLVPNDEPRRAAGTCVDTL